MINGTPEKRTTDWILEDETSILFIECKTKRITQVSKTSLNYTEELEKDLQKMASFVVQLYRGFSDYSSDLYPQLQYNSKKDFIPLVITLEEWNLGFSQALSVKLNTYVIEGLTTANIDGAIVDKFPYKIMSCAEFEKDIQVISDIGIKEYFDKRKQKELHDFLKQYRFRAWYREDFKRLFLDPLHELVQRNSS